MAQADEFVDYYEILQVNPNCDLKIIENSYRHFAKIYHPDHEETADKERFATVIDAYNNLKFPEKRAAYDELYNAQKQRGSFLHEPVVSSETATSDATMQKNILAYLYRRKRENFKEPGVAGFYIQKQFGCTDDTYDFHVWYLKSKGFVEITEQGTLSITVLGVDHVISTHQPKAREILLTDQSQINGNPQNSDL